MSLPWLLVFWPSSTSFIENGGKRKVLIRKSTDPKAQLTQPKNIGLPHSFLVRRADPSFSGTAMAVPIILFSSSSPHPFSGMRISALSFAASEPQSLYFSSLPSSISACILPSRSVRRIVSPSFTLPSRMTFATTVSTFFWINLFRGRAPKLGS